MGLVTQITERSRVDSGGSVVSDSIRPITMDSLPNEILGGILHLLPIYSLKDARLTCKSWRDAGARYLFRRVYFAPRYEVMDVFTNITQNPAFASNIEELVYDARLFWGYMEVPKKYRKALSRNFPKRYPFNPKRDRGESDSDEDVEEYDNGNNTVDSHGSGSASTDATNESKASFEEAYRVSISRYSSLLREQNQILNEGKDLALLRTGFKQLRKLKRILILDKFNEPVEYLHFHWDIWEFDWYEKWSAELYKGIAQPTPWWVADITNRGTRLRDFPWGFESVTHLLLAAKEYVPQLRELYVGCQCSQLSWEIYSRVENVKLLRQIAPRLTCFQLNCSAAWFEPSPPRSQRIKAVENILKETKCLRELALSTSDTYEDMWSGIFCKIKWPHLRVLDLADGLVTAGSLRAILSAHCDTLRELRFRYLHITEGSWADVAREAGPSLKLHMITLYYVGVGEGRQRQLGVLDAANVARDFLQCFPSHVLRARLVEPGGAIAWHKQDFKPAYEIKTI
ncbi:MAG: hypothetical protein Q9191_003812 [Dirinaria sp. TL-2023a]